MKFKNKTINGFCSTVETRGLLSSHCLHFYLQIKSCRSKKPLLWLRFIKPRYSSRVEDPHTKLLTKGLQIEMVLRGIFFYPVSSVTAVSKVRDY